MDMNTVIAFVERFGVAAVVFVILAKWVCPKIDDLGKEIQALTMVLAVHFQITPEQLADAKTKLNGKK
jgi:hypothetical protein